MTIQTEPLVGKVSLENLCQNGDDLSPERLEQFLQNVINLGAEKHGVRPDALVKIVYDGELIILTQEQADHMLHDPAYNSFSLNSLRQAVERALKGDAAVIRQELMVLIMMGRMMLDSLKGDQSINPLEIARIDPLLDRTEKQSNQILQDILLITERINDMRAKHPIISEYEMKVGQMLEMQQNANLQQAKRIAMELQSKKKNYLFCCRALEPDVKWIQFRRLDFQKIKKRVLSVHKYLLAQKVDGLHAQLNQIRESVQSLTLSPVSNSGSGFEAVYPSHEENGHMSSSIAQHEEQLESLKKQNQIVEMEESRTDSVIHEISHNVLQVPDAAEVSDQITHTDRPRNTNATPKKKNPSRVGRMATINRRR